MFTERKVTQFSQGKKYVEAVCLAADTKPTEGIANGSLVIEMDTNKVYYFDGDNEAWAEIGTESEKPVYTVTLSNNTSSVLSMVFAYADSMEAAISGSVTPFDDATAHGTATASIPKNGVVIWDGDTDISSIDYNSSVMELKYFEAQGTQFPYLEIHGSGTIQYTAPEWQTVETYTATYTASMKSLEAMFAEGIHFTPAIGDKYRVSINDVLLDQVFDITANQGFLYMTDNVYSGNFDTDYGFYVMATEYNPSICVLHNFDIADGDTRLVTLEKLM